MSTGTGGSQTGNITVASPITMTGASSASLTLDAYNNIAVNAAITATGSGALSVTLTPNTGAAGGTSTIASTIGSAASGGVLTLSGTTTMSSGTVQNMTIAGSPLTIAGGNNYFSGVTLDTDTTVASGSLIVMSGLTFAAAHTLTVGSGTSGAALYYSGTQSWGGSGNLVFGGTGGDDFYLSGVAATLTIGAGITTSNTTSTIGSGNFVNQGLFNVNAPVDYYGSFVNQGTMNLSPSTGVAYFGDSGAGIFTNGAGGVINQSAGTTELGYYAAAIIDNSAGTINVTGGTLDLSGQLTQAGLGTITRGASGTVQLFTNGTLTNSGAIDLSSGGPWGAIVIDGGTLVGGTLQNAGSGSNAVQVNTGTSIFNGVTLNQDVMVSSGSLTLQNGLTFENGHTLTFGSGTTAAGLYYTGSQSLLGSGNLVFGSTSTDYFEYGGGQSSSVLTLAPGIATHFNTSTNGYGNITNQGTMTIGGPVDLYGSVTNLGTISQTTAVTGYLGDSAAGSFTNASGGVLNLSAGTLNLGYYSSSTIDNALGTINVTGGTLNFEGQVSQVGLGTITRGAAGTIALGTDATLTPTAGGTIDLSVGGPWGGIVFAGGTLAGGTLQNTGAGNNPVLVTTGTFNGVTLNQDVTVAGGDLYTVNGLVFENGRTLTLGSGAIAGGVEYSGTQTFSGAGNLVIAGTSTNYMQAYVAGTTLTLAPGITTLISSGATLNGYGSLVNQGAMTTNGYLDFYDNFTNQGTLTQSGTATNTYLGDGGAGAFVNTGTINISAGTMDLGYYATSTINNAGGTINVTGGTVTVDGLVTPAGFGTITRGTAGAVELGTDATLTVSGPVDLSSGGPWGTIVVAGATISGATLANSGSGTNVVDVLNGTFTGVTLDQDVTVASGNLYIVGGLTLQNGHTLTLGNSTAAGGLIFNGTQSISGTGNLVAAGAGSDIIEDQTAGTTLTFGAGITTHLNASTLGYGLFANQGNFTITNAADFYGGFANSGTLNVANGTSIAYLGDSTTGAFSNSGVLNVSAGTLWLGYYGTSTIDNSAGIIHITGGLLSFDGEVTPSAFGTITRGAAGTVQLGYDGTLAVPTTVDLSSGGPWGAIVLNGGTVVGGTLQNSGSGANAVQITGSSTFNGVTLNQDVDVANGELTLDNGLTIQNSHTLNVASGATEAGLEYNGSQGISGLGNVVFGTSASAYLEYAGAANTVLTLGSGITTNIKSSFFSYANVVNQGVLNINANADLNGNFTNQGTVNQATAAATSDLADSTTGIFTNAAGGVVNLSAGQMTLGDYATSTIDNSAGTLNVTGGLLSLQGLVTPAQLGSITRGASGTVQLGYNGTLTASGPLDLSSGGPWGTIAINGGTVAGGILQSSGSGTSAVMITGNAIFNGVTLNQDVDVTGGNLTVDGGLAFENGHDLNVGTGTQTGVVTFNGSQSFTGTGNLVLGSATANAYLESAVSGTALTFAPGITVTSNGNAIFNGSTSTLINQGALLVRNNSVFTDEGTFTNNGVIDVGAGSAFSTNNTNFTNPAGGTIRGAGTFNVGTVAVCNPTCVAVDNTLTNLGTIDPGSGVGGTGLLTVAGNLALGASGTVHADLAGTTAGLYDQLKATGTLQLGGILQIAEQGATTVGGFFAQVGNTFPNMVTATGATSGAFASFAPPADVTFTTNLSGTAVGITNTTQSITRFDSPSGGDWSNPANWSRGVPTSTSTVFIQEAGNPTITISSGSLTANSITGSDPLDITGGTLTLPASYTTAGGNISLDGGTLVNNNALTFPTTLNLNSGTISGTGTLSLTGTLNHGTTGTATIDEAFNNQGTVNVTTGSLALDGDGTHTGVFNISSGAILDFAGGTQTVTAAGGLAGAGEMLVSGGDITMDGAYSLPGAPVQTGGVLVFHPSGAITVPSYTATGGTVTWGNVNFTDYTNNGTAISNFTDATTLGTMNQGGGTVNFNASGNSVGTYNLTGGTVNSSGMTITTAGNFSAGTFNVLAGSTLSGAGAVTLNGATLTSTGTTNLQDLTLTTGGTLNGAGTITLANLTWSGTGTVSGAGALDVTNSLTLSGAAGGPGAQIGRTITNSGTATESGNYYVQMTGGAIFDNSGSFTISDNSNYGGTVSSGATGTFNNSGTLTKSGGTDSTFYGTVFNNSGTVKVNAGTLVLPDGGTETGAFQVASGSQLTLENQQPTWGTGTITLGDGSSFSGAGTVLAQTGLALSGTAAGTTVAAGTTLNLANATLTGAGKLANAGTIDLNGTTLAATITNTGTLDVIGSSNLTGAALTLSSGTLDIAANQTLTKTGGAFDWSGGTIAGSGHLDLAGGAALALTGTSNTLNGPSLSVTNFTLPSGTLTVQGTSTLTVAGTSSVAASATLNISATTFTDNGTLTNAGTLNLTNAAVGGTGSVTNSGTMAVSGGNFAPALTSTGTLNFTGGTTVFSQPISEDAGLVSLSGGNLQGSISVIGGLLRGTGTITGNVDNVSGNLSPGFSPGQINIVGNLTLGPSSTMTELITGTTPGSGFDVVTVSGTASLNGTLNISLGNGFVPATGASFQYLSYGTLAGAFATINQPTGYTFTNVAAAAAAQLQFGAVTTTSTPTAPVVVAPAPPAVAPQGLPDAVSTTLQGSVTAVNDATGSTSPEEQAGGTGTEEGAAGASNSAAGVDASVAGTLADPLAALLGVPGLMIDPAQPFVGHPANVNACSR